MKQYITIFSFLFSALFSNEKIGYILNVDGYVKIMSDEKNVLNLDAVKGRYIYENDVIRSVDNSVCTIIFLDNSAILSISENSEISINNHTPKKDSKKVELNYGQVYIENASNSIPFFLITPATQVRCLSSSAFIKSSFEMDDSIYTFDKAIDFYNKKAEKVSLLEAKKKAVSTLAGEIFETEQEKGFLPKKILESVSLNKASLKIPAGEFSYKKGDLIIDDLGDYVLDVYKVPEIRKIKLDAAISNVSIKGDFYAKIALYPSYKNKNLNIDLRIDHYFKDKNSPALNGWNEPSKILAKIKRVDYFNNSKTFVLKSGGLDGITLGHGLLVKEYGNYLNYPLKSSHGMQFKYSYDNFIDVDFFSSNIGDFLSGDGFWGLHASLFVSKYAPIKLGFGFVSDMNQFSDVPDIYSMMPSRNIRGLEFDATYPFHVKANYSFDFIGEIGALTFPEKHYYKRYNSSGDVASGLKNKSGAWGLSAGIQGIYKELLKVKTLFHYNDPLFLPSFFNRTYDIERYRLLLNKEEYSDITAIDNMVEDFQYNENDDSSDSELALIPKDMYLAYIDKEFSYPSAGFTIDGVYNYYDKILGHISYTSIFEMANEYSESKTISSFDIGLEVGRKVLKNIEAIKFNYSKNLSEDIMDFSDQNENTAISLSLIGKLKFGLILDLKFERVNYDYDFNGDADNIDIIDIGLIYRIY